MKHNNEYRIYEINQNLINFLRGDGKYRNRPLSCIDKQIYSHYGEFKLHSDKYIGIIIEFQKQMFFAPLTHDGNKIWFKRDDTYDFEKIYDTRSNYVGSLLLCKALPLTHNLFKFLPLGEILKDEGEKYFWLCRNELNYLNSKNIHAKIQNKMLSCIYGEQSNSQDFRINYDLAIRNVAEYNVMLLGKTDGRIVIS